MIPTSADVAERAGVSRATVSQILNGHEDRFATETAEKVLQAARELDYRPSVAGRALARGSSDIVIALIPNTTFGANFQDIFELLTDELARRGLTLLMQLSTGGPDLLDKVLTSIKPRAALSLAGFSPEEREMLRRRGILGIEAPALTENDPIQHIASTQADHLIARGYRRLAFAHLDDVRQELYGQSREEKFRAVCSNRGLDAPYVLALDLNVPSALKALESLPGKGFAIACYNDDVATALLAAATHRGWDVPRELALIGLDNTPLAQLTSPPLTTIEYDLTSVAQTATAWALAILDGRESEVTPIPIELRLQLGGTT